MTEEIELPNEIQAYPTTARSLRVRASVLDATRQLLTEGGLPAATVDAISLRSGVSKATIYKHWPSRVAVAAEAFGRSMSEAIPLADTGSGVKDLAEHTRRVSAFYASAEGAIFSQLTAACVTSPEARVYFRDYFLTSRRQAMATLWERALAQGEVDPAINADTAMDLLVGPLIFRLLSGHKALTEEEADAISSAALQGLLVNRRS